MPRIPYLSDDAGPGEVVASIKARRGGRLTNLDRVLLHSPPYAAGWSAMMKRMRGEVELPPLMAELAMCAVATLNRSDYQYHHHAKRFLASGGSAAQLLSIRMLPNVTDQGSLFDATQRALLALAVQMTCNVSVTEAVFEEARLQLGSDRLMLEAVGIIAAHNMVSRVLVACEVGIES